MAKKSVPKKNLPNKAKQKGTLSAKQIEFLSSLKENLGIVSKAAHDCNIHRNTHYEWTKNPKYKEEYEAILEDCIDVVENQLMNNILAGDVASILFYLKTKAKKRGYIEKAEVGFTDTEGNDVKEQVIVIGGREIKF